MLTYGRGLPLAARNALELGLGRSRWDILRMLVARSTRTHARNTVCARRLRMNLAGRAVTVWCRDTSSDVEVFQEVFVECAYPVRDALRQSHPTVLDLGANTGLTSSLFAAWAPRARIVAVEPLPHNLSVLLANAAEPWHRSWQVVPAAVGAGHGQADFHWSGWYSSGTLNADIADARQGNVGRQEHHQAMPPLRVPTTPVQHVVDTLGLSEIDLVKVDVEGAEESLFSGDPSWLRQTGCIAIDVHDRYIDGEAVRARLRRSGFHHVGQTNRTAVFRR